MAVGLAVGGDDALVDPPGRFALDVGLDGDHGGEPLALSVGEQLGPGAQDPPDPVERVPGATAVAAGGLLESLTAAVQGIPGGATTWKRSITVTAAGRASAAADL